MPDEREPRVPALLAKLIEPRPLIPFNPFQDLRGLRGGKQPGELPGRLSQLVEDPFAKFPSLPWKVSTCLVI